MTDQLDMFGSDPTPDTRQEVDRRCTCEDGSKGGTAYCYVCKARARDDQLLVYREAKQIDDWASVPATDPKAIRAGLAALAAQGPPAREKTGSMVVTRAVFDAMTRFLAGMVYREETAFEKLSAAKRKTAERAAQAAVNVFANETEETHE